MRIFNMFCTLLLLAVLIGSARQSPNSTISFTANEGLIIQSQDYTIAVDAFFEKEFDYLDSPSKETNENLKIEI